MRLSRRYEERRRVALRGNRFSVDEAHSRTQSGKKKESEFSFLFFFDTHRAYALVTRVVLELEAFASRARALHFRKQCEWTDRGLEWCAYRETLALGRQLYLTTTVTDVRVPFFPVFFFFIFFFFFTSGHLMTVVTQDVNCDCVKCMFKQPEVS